MKNLIQENYKMHTIRKKASNAKYNIYYDI